MTNLFHIVEHISQNFLHFNGPLHPVWCITIANVSTFSQLYQPIKYHVEQSTNAKYHL